MKHFPLKTICALTFVAACAGGGQLSKAQDLHPEAGGDWLGYAPPSAAYDEGTGWLCATWMDHVLFSRDEGRYADTDFFGFAFEVDDGEGWQPVATVPNVAGSMTGCYDLSGWEDGSYRFRITARAVQATSQATTTHRTSAWEGSVVVGPGSR